MPLPQRCSTATTLTMNKAVPIDAPGWGGGAGAVAISQICPDEEGVAAVLRRLGEHDRSTGRSGGLSSKPRLSPASEVKPPATRGGPSGHTVTGRACHRNFTLAAARSDAPLGRYVRRSEPVRWVTGTVPPPRPRVCSGGPAPSARIGGGSWPRNSINVAPMMIMSTTTSVVGHGL